MSFNYLFTFKIIAQKKKLIGVLHIWVELLTLGLILDDLAELFHWEIPNVNKFRSFLLDYSERSDSKFLLSCLEVEADCQYLENQVGEENQILKFK